MAILHTVSCPRMTPLIETHTLKDKGGLLYSYRKLQKDVMQLFFYKSNIASLIFLDHDQQNYKL